MAETLTPVVLRADLGTEYPGIVDQDIDRLVTYLCCGRIDRGVVGDVDRDEPKSRICVAEPPEFFR